MKKHQTYCGNCTIIGRPNVGKSTLLNKLLGQKISVTSKKPQTTRNWIVGVQTKGIYQVIYFDTPGLSTKEKNLTNRIMNRMTIDLMHNAQLIIFMVDRTQWTKEDENILKKVKFTTIPIVLVINKIDKIKNKTVLLPYFKMLNQKMNFAAMIPISAQIGKNIDTIIKIIHQYLPYAQHKFPKDFVTNNTQNFMASEIIREKLIRFLGDELPYCITVSIEKFILNKYDIYHIYALIIVECKSHKKIIIGHKGTKLKTIGIESRKDLEKMLKKKVNLKLWVTIQLSHEHKKIV